MQRHRQPRPLHIALVAPSLGILGGQAVQADRLLRAWHMDPEIHAWLVPINPVPQGGLRRLVHIKYMRTIVTQLLYWPLLFRELRRADVVHVFSASYFSFLIAPLPAVLIAKLLGKPVLMNYRSGEAPDHLERSAIARAVLKWVERNVVPSRFLLDVFAAYGIRAGVVPNIVDTDRFRFRRREPLRPSILSTRNFETLYDVASTLRAFRIIQDRYPDATLTLVGSGSEETRLRELATELRLENVRFVGRVSPEDICQYYAESDIYLQTPDIDNMPSSVIEAFSSGCPVVSTNAGGVPAILTHDKHGLLVERGDHAAAAASVIRLLEEPDLARRLAAVARESCEQYRWDTVRAQWISVYESMVTPCDTMPERTASAV